MTRIPRLRPQALDGPQRELYTAMTSGPRGPALVDEDGALRGPFNAFLLSPPVGAALQDVGVAVRYRSSLPDRVREMATLAVAHHWDSAYEWRAHERLARAVGVTDEQIAALQQGEIPDLPDPTEQQGVALVMMLLEGAVSDAAWTRFVDALGAPAIFEISTLVGYYGTLALQMRLFDVR